MQKDRLEEFKDLYQKTPAPSNELNRKVLQEMERRGDSVKHRYLKPVIGLTMAAAAFGIVFLTSDHSIAKAIRNTFAGFFAQDERLKTDLEKNIFKDEDQHASVSVTEILSDEQFVQITVKYEAKDEKGKEWLQKYTLGRDYRTRLEPDYTTGGAPGGMTGATMLKKESTDTVQYYMVRYIASETDVTMKNMIFTYELPSTKQNKYSKTILDTSATVPVYEYTLKPEGGKQFSKYIEPKLIRLSKLSWSVYGKQHGLYGEQYTETSGGQWSLISIEKEEKHHVKEASFSKKDGSILTMEPGGGGMGPISLAQRKIFKGCDSIVISHDFFSHYMDYVPEDSDYMWDDDEKKTSPETFRPEEMTSVTLTNELGSVTYTFE